MPGKVNPTQCEAVTMVAAQVMGNNVAGMIIYKRFLNDSLYFLLTFYNLKFCSNNRWLKWSFTIKW
jgi:hypothetical protein